MKRLNIAKLKEELNYNPITGVFTYAKPPNTKFKRGARAGGKDPSSHGYINITTQGVCCSAHRLAWL